MLEMEAVTIWEMTPRRVKRSQIWVSGILADHVWVQFNIVLG